MKCISFHGGPSNLPYNLERLCRAWWQVILLKQPASCCPAEPSVLIHIQCGSHRWRAAPWINFLVPGLQQTIPIIDPRPSPSLLEVTTWNTCFCVNRLGVHAQSYSNSFLKYLFSFHEVGREQMRFSSSFPLRSTSCHGQKLVLFPRGKSMFAYL